MLNFLQRLFGRTPRNSSDSADLAEMKQHPPEEQEIEQHLPEEAEMKKRWDELERKVLESIEEERAAELLLPRRELIKKRMNLPSERPAECQPDESRTVLSLVRKGTDAVPSVVVLNQFGVAIEIPRTLLEYLYGEASPRAEDLKMIKDSVL